MKEELKPRDFVVPDQLFDRTKNRASTFFENGIVAHVGFADPYCAKLSEVVSQTIKEIGVNVHKGGTYICMEGPQFSTKAESNFYRQQGFSIIGMTALPEAKLAREAEMCYATVALVTDYDVWKEGEEVNVEAVLETIAQNVNNVKRLLKHMLPLLVKRQRVCQCNEALQGAVMTKITSANRAQYNKLKLLLEK